MAATRCSKATANLRKGGDPTETATTVASKALRRQTAGLPKNEAKRPASYQGCNEQTNVQVDTNRHGGIEFVL